MRPGEPDLAGGLEQVVEASPSALVLIASARESARILSALRDSGLVALTFCGPQVGRRPFLLTLEAGKGPDAPRNEGSMLRNLAYPILWERSWGGERGEAFARRFRERFGLEPDYAAAYTYDATLLLFEAIRAAGLNRARIRDAIRSLEPWEGVTGTIRWAPTGRRKDARIEWSAPPERRNAR